VGLPDERWGDRPKGFVTLNPGAASAPEELIEFGRGRLAGYRVPRAIDVLDVMPTTPTGKAQKFLLRERVRG
jgi:fatty-acyl-CoA synthase